MSPFPLLPQEIYYIYTVVNIVMPQIGDILLKQCSVYGYEYCFLKHYELYFLKFHFAVKTC